MGGFTPNQTDIIARLRLDPTKFKEGYNQARQIAAQANSELLGLDAARIRMRGELESKYTVSQRAEIARRISDLQAELQATISAMASKSGAEQAALAASAAGTREKLAAQVAEMENYKAIVARLGEVTAAMRVQQAAAKEGQSAATIFQSKGIASGAINTPFAAIQQQIAMLAPGMAGLQSRLGAIFNTLVIMGGGIKGASQGFDELGSVGTAASTSLLGPLSLVVGVAAAVGAGMLKAGLSAGEWAHNLSILSAETGISMKDLEGFQYVGRTTGLSIDDMSMATKRLATSIVTESPALAQLGIRVKDAGGNFRGVTDVLFDLSAAFQTIPTDTEKVRIATELLGRSGQRLIDTLNQGPDALHKLFDEAAAKGPEDLGLLDEQFEKTEKASADLSLALLNLESRFGFSMGIWATAKETMASFLQQLGKVPPSVEGAEAGGNADLFPQHVLPEAGAPSTPQVPGLPTGPGFLDRRTPKAPATETAAQIDATSKADEALSVALGKQGPIMKQIADAQAIVNEKRAEYLALDAQLKDLAGAMGVTEPRNKAETEYAAAITRVNELKKQQATLDKENAKWWEEHDKRVGNTFKKPIGTPSAAGVPSGNFLGPVVPLPSKQSPFELETIAGTEAKPILQMMLNAPGVVDVMTTFMQQFSGRQLFGGGKSGQTGGKGFDPMLGPNATTATLGTAADEKKQTDAALAAKAISAEQAVKAYQDQKAMLQDLLQQNMAMLDPIHQGEDGYNRQLDAVNKIREAINGVTTSLKEAQKNTIFSQLMNTFDQLASVAGKFSAGLGKAFSDIGASLSIATKSYKDFQAQQNAGNKIGEAGDILSAGGPAIASAFGGQGVAGIGTSAVGGAAAGAMLGSVVPGLGTALGGALGAAVGTTLGGIGAWKTAKQADAMRDVNEISDKVKQINSELSNNVIGVQNATVQLFQQLAAAKAQMTTGKDGNQQQMEGVIASITDQIVNLQAQAAKTIVDFKAAIGMFAVPVGIQSYAAALVQIQTALKAAAGAGASAADQVAYLNGSLKALQTTIGDTLTSEQQNVVGMMLQTLDLAQQRSQIVMDENLAEQQIQMSLGLAPTLTPGQEAAKQIAILRRNEALQLAQIDQQKALLQAQLDGQMQLFGWTQKDLDATNAKTLLLQEQVDLQKMVTAETIATVQAQMAYFATLAGGGIPNLPAGLNVPGANYPGGANYTTNINITVTGTNATPELIAKAVTDALNQVNIARQQGLQP